MNSLQQKEGKLRRELKKQGYALRKSRVRNTHVNDCGGYMIIDANSNFIEAGSRFELSIEDVEKFVKE